MRRSICYCEPNSALAGAVGTWKFIYSPATSLPKGTRLRFDLQSQGRPIDWETPSATLKKQRNVIYAFHNNGKVVEAKEVEVPDRYVPYYEFTLPSALSAGTKFTIVLGPPKGKSSSKKNSGNAAQCHTQRRRSFLLSIDPTGKGKYGDPEVFNIDIRGNVLKTIKVITPSFVIKNRRFDVIVRFEDEFGNLTSNAPEDTLIELGYEHLRENLNWKLFVPETGFIALPNLYFNEVGIYTITLVNTKTGDRFHSSPIKCFSESNKQLFWGLLHGESEKIDSTENIESCLRHFRDEKAFNFCATSSFESAEETPNDIWKEIAQNIAEFEEEDRFATLLGFQWVGSAKEEGVRQFIYAKDHKPILRKKDTKTNTLKKIYKLFAPKEIISIPSFTMGKGYSYSFKSFSPEFERVVEIYNAWGSSECSAKEGNPLPIKGSGKAGIKEDTEGSIQKALQNNCRFGFAAGGLDDRGIYTDLYEGDQTQYHPGLTAIIAPEYSRQSILEALFNRSCYATTGERIIVGIYVAGAPMGSEINTAKKPGLLVNRHISGYVAGTCPLTKVEIIRNGKVLKLLKPEKGYAFEFSYDDMDPLEKVAIRPAKKAPPFIYYYLRVTQQNGHMAWSSPIWVDLLPPGAAKAEAKRSAKNTKVEEVEEDEELEDKFEEEDEDFDDEDEDE